MKFKIKLSLIGLIFLLSLFNSDEGLCPLQPTESSNESCGSETNSNTNESSATSNSDYPGQTKNTNPQTKSEDLVIEDVPKESSNPNVEPKNTLQTPKNIADRKKNKSPEKKIEVEKIDYPEDLQYQELFQRPGEREKYINSFTMKSNETEFYDFNLDDEELDSIKKARFTIYPPKKFQFNYQGNFLHFYKIAYEKKLPVYFTVDSMLYALNENINKLNLIYYEEILIFYLRTLYVNIVNYANELMDSPEGEPHRYMISHAQLYYSIAYQLLVDGFEKPKFPLIIESQIKNFIEKIKKYDIAEFYMFYSKKKINCGVLAPSGFFVRSKKLQNIHHSLKWFHAAKFLINEKEIKPIWFLGKLIVDSGNEELYRKIFESLNFIMGQDALTPSIVDIYKLGLDMGFTNTFDLSEVQANHLIVKAMGKKREINLPFLNDNFFYNKNMLDAFRIERELSTYVFTYPFDVEEWVKNKLLVYSPNQLRIMMSSYEITSTIHHASAFKQLIFNRYKGIKTFEGETFIPLRDKVDLTENFEKTKYSIKDLMKDHPEKWRKSVTSHMHLILYQSSRKIKSYDPVFKEPAYYEKLFFTAYSAYIHFKREFALMKSQFEVKKNTGEIPEVVIEPNLKFYEEILELAKNYKNFFEDLSKFSENGLASQDMKFTFVNVKAILTQLTDVTEMLIDGIERQESGRMTKETKENLKDIITYNKEYEAYMGWYVRLLDQNSQKTVFDFYAWAARVHTAPPIEDQQFSGAMFYNHLNYPIIGLIVKQDKFEKKEKLLLFTCYSAKEITKRFDPKLNFDEEIKAISERE